jgi:hypothetical protein
VVRKLSERTQAIVFVVVLGVAIAGLYGWIQVSQPPPVRAAGVSGVGLVVDGPGWTIHYGPVTTTNNTAFGVLLEAARRVGFSLHWVNYTLPAGVFVISINGSANGQGGEFWQFWVNGVYGDAAADHAPLSDGATVTWRFTSDQGGTAG